MPIIIDNPYFKGQLISNFLFWCLQFSHKTNENNFSRSLGLYDKPVKNQGDKLNLIFLRFDTDFDFQK